MADHLTKAPDDPEAANGAVIHQQKDTASNVEDVDIGKHQGEVCLAGLCLIGDTWSPSPG